MFLLASMNPSSGSSPRAEMNLFLSPCPLDDSRLKGIMLSILTLWPDLPPLNRTSDEQRYKGIIHSGWCADGQHSFHSNFKNKIDKNTSIYSFFLHFAVSTAESSFLAVIYLPSRWLNVQHPRSVSARRHDGCLPALFLPVIECYGPEEVSAAFNICSLSLCHCIIPAPIASSSWTHPLGGGTGEFFSIFHCAMTCGFSSPLRAVGRTKRNVAEDVSSVLAPSARRSRSCLGNYAVAGVCWVIHHGAISTVAIK